MLIIRLVMVHMGPKHTQYGQKTARLAPVLQNGLKGHVQPPTCTHCIDITTLNAHVHKCTITPHVNADTTINISIRISRI